MVTEPQHQTPGTTDSSYTGFMYDSAGGERIDLDALRERLPRMDEQAPKRFAFLMSGHRRTNRA